MRLSDLLWLDPQVCALTDVNLPERSMRGRSIATFGYSPGRLAARSTRALQNGFGKSFQTPSRASAGARDLAESMPEADSKGHPGRNIKREGNRTKSARPSSGRRSSSAAGRELVGRRGRI